METIFVQIASYRDPELKPTILDCVQKAKYPERVSFGICWQNCEKEREELTDFLYSLSRTRIINVDFMESEGVCWARSLTQSLYQGENYTLQIDSHMLFDKDWDVQLIEYLKNCESIKPLLSCYPNNFQDRNLIKDLDRKPAVMHFNGTDNDGMVKFVAYNIEEVEKPIRGWFLAAGFIFTLGQFCLECKYDPQLYFHGEEISLGVRSYTKGYDVYYPPRNIIWHLYKIPGSYEKDSCLHWKDHSRWWERDVISKKRVQQLLGQQDHNIDLGDYGLGTVRTLDEYKKASSLNFKMK